MSRPEGLLETRHRVLQSDLALLRRETTLVLDSGATFLGPGAARLLLPDVRLGYTQADWPSQN